MTGAILLLKKPSQMDEAPWLDRVSLGGVRQSVTYRYREFPVPGIFNFSGGIGTNKDWKKVSEPVSEKFDLDRW